MLKIFNGFPSLKYKRHTLQHRRPFVVCTCSLFKHTNPPPPRFTLVVSLCMCSAPVLECSPPQPSSQLSLSLPICSWGLPWQTAWLPSYCLWGTLLASCHQHRVLSMFVFIFVSFLAHELSEDRGSFAMLDNP